jgi:alpha,alpha-trehalase
MDGVVTDTAATHAAAWKRLFDEYLACLPPGSGADTRPFDIALDYRPYVDGKPRFDGVRDFLVSRGIHLAWGTPDDPPTHDTVCGLGNRKNDYFLTALESEGARAYPSTVRLIERLRADGKRCAVISASQNMPEVLEAAGVADLFDARVDGNDLIALDLAGKPDPAMFLEAARRLATAVEVTAVVEDAIAGAEAGRAGGFALVVGVDRHADPGPLLRAGADIVVADLSELLHG